ncbi:MAG TPA: hypothetical protein VEL03_14740 [Streptosporangiaceae bacterium]|nr:hypothetical protein [Streptosporangiaceae bacterium]
MLSHSIRVGIPTATDPEGRTGQGYWWITGTARPGLLPERTRLHTPWRQRLRLRRGSRHQPLP